MYDGETLALMMMVMMMIMMMTSYNAGECFVFFPTRIDTVYLDTTYCNPKVRSKVLGSGSSSSRSRSRRSEYWMLHS